MEKRIKLIGLLLIMFLSYTYAKTVTSEEARQCALVFLNKNASCAKGVKGVRTGIKLVQIYPASNEQTRAASDADYYIFNTADSSAFVVISGESTTKAVLAYSYDGAFSMDNIAPGAKYFLDSYAEQIQKIRSGEATAVAASSMKKAPSTGKLLTTATWNQGAPYNNDCPSISGTKCYTGCVATAMGIIMKYHNWPASGIGSQSYTSGTNKLSLNADFSAAAYDWNNATSSYSASSTDTENAAVAKILYHCGVAALMDYGTSESAAYVENACKALKYNFKYSPYTHVCTRTGIKEGLNILQLYSMYSNGLSSTYMQTYYSDDEWKNLLYTEIDADRPVLYTGTSSSFGAHAFVCDGYDTEGNFHFNMGWGGSSNAYYSIDAISSGYNFIQSAIMGITPDENFDGNAQLELGANVTASDMGLFKDATSKVMTITAKNITPAAKAINTAYMYYISYFNIGNIVPYAYSIFKGYYAAALYAVDGTFKCLLSTPEQLSPLNGTNPYQPKVVATKNITCTITSGMNIQPTDRIWLVGSADGTNWYRAYCTDLDNSSIPVSGYDGVFFCNGNNGRSAYAYGSELSTTMTSKLEDNTTDVTAIDLSGISPALNSVDVTGTNPNAVVTGASSVTGAIASTSKEFTLTDGYPFYANEMSGVTSVKYSRVFNADNATSKKSMPVWQTICLPFDVSSVTYGEKTFNVTDFWLYQMTTSGYVRVKEGNIKKNTPYIIAFANADEYASTGLNVSGTVTFTGNGTVKTEDGESDVYTAGNYKLVNYYAPKTTNNSYYALNTAGTQFVSGDEIAPFRPYAVKKDEASPAKGMTIDIFNNDATGIGAVADETSMSIKVLRNGIEVTAPKTGRITVATTGGAIIGAFNINAGTKVIDLPQGIFVVNGKTVMIAE